MRHAFLIIAHSNWKQVAAFVSAIDTDRCDFFIHVNKNVCLPEETIKMVEQSATKSKVYFTKRIPVIWGGAGICEASILLLEEAYERHKYDYYHLMTGTDLLVKPFEQFDSFFELNVYNNESEGEYKTNYISYGTPSKKMMSRLAYYNFFVSQWRNSNKYIRKLATMTNSLLCEIQNIIGINRVKKQDFDIYCGSSWWSISNEFSLYYIKAAKEFMRIFGSKTFAIDEFCPQTVVVNSKFKRSLYLNPSGIAKNLRLLDFERGNGYGSPHIWTIEDKNEVLETGNLIGRKFDSEIDVDIVKIVLNMIHR